MMHSLVAYFKRERATGAMFLFILLSLFWYYLSPPEEPAVPEDYSKKSRIETARDIQRVSREVLSRPGPETRGVQAMALGLFTVISAGLLLDILSFLYYRRHRFLPAEAFPGEPTRWGLGDVFKVLVVLFFLEIVTGFLAQVVLSMAGVLTVDQNPFVMGVTFLRNAFITFYLIWWVLWRDRLGMAALGLVTRGWVKDITTGIAFYTGLFPVYFGVALLVMFFVQLVGYETPVQTVVQIVYREESQRLVFIFSVFIAVLGPIFEEILFRGFIYRAFRNRWGVARALVLSSVLFALLHAHLVAFIPVLVLGLGLGLCYEKTRSLLPGMVLHMCHNMIALGLMLQVKALS